MSHNFRPFGPLLAKIFDFKKKVPDGPNQPSQYFVYENADFQRIFMKFFSETKNKTSNDILVVFWEKNNFS